MNDIENPYASLDGHREVSRLRSPIRLRWIVLALFATLGLLSLGYAPGSSGLEDIAVRGNVTQDGRPLTDVEVELILPATYGLSASEAKNPAQFGNATRGTIVSTDSQGGFSHSFGPAAYHVDNFFLPFHIRIPNRAPALWFYMRVPSVSSELYLVEAREGTYRVVAEDGHERSSPNAPIDSFTVREKLSRPNEIPVIEAIVQLRYRRARRIPS